MDFLNIKEQIKSKGYTYETFGKEVGLTKTSIARIVSGTQTPSFEMLAKIAKTLDVDIKDLFHSTKTTMDPKTEIQHIINQLENLKNRL
ncbi:putative transcriptional regulator [Tenacibaculum maritimum]|uniref:helix-turn-helix domain-containing protein n=1 Tax=Tenacibaculum maritimum TaxID=107401 RepID=UPI0012E49954|nr:helix-turn-helix transcriptional regulator [Tenacibaculum maritimum]MDB0599988.1 helix-turn-helix transcriptional regulator [Tenacibaculum maritimum]MDB0611132.1 helix-turn-helix transcriptional regulator [Tenacibaculum maritimum]CAA0146712.1 putative transcriptional regulator [Tenacibaculum maritimum]CAA0191464.1 putative transcriptional regulator [Tenacibaculum maritimum]CAA0224547.1 putative transcriptional regulator [Tenacibaculum maritimum]